MKTPSINKSQTDFRVDIDKIHLDGAPVTFKTYREQAWKIYQKTPFPNLSMDTWKKTKINELKLENLTLINYENQKDICLPKDVLELIDSGNWAGWLYLSSRGNKYWLNEIWIKQGVLLMDLRTAIQSESQVFQACFSNQPSTIPEKFILLAQAFAQSGVIFFVPDHVEINQPILIFIEGRGENEIHALQHLIRLGKESSATVIISQSYNEKKKIENVSSVIEEIAIDAGSELNLIDIELSHPSWWIFNDKSAKIYSNGKLNWLLYAEGGLYSRSRLDVQLIGTASNAEVTGIYMANNTNQVDWQTSQKHLESETFSDLLFCGALANQARSNWSGMIRISPNIVKADGYQANLNLLLCNEPRVESKPGLEILADDIRCSHGVAIGEIDKNQMFYLQSRGIPENEAKRLIAQGFLESTLTRLPDSFAQEFVREKIQEKIKHYFC